MESSLCSAWKDTERFRQSAGSFWGLEIMGASVLGLGGSYIGFLLTPEGATPKQSFTYPAIGGVLGVIGGLVIMFLLIYAWNLFRAPYRQRNQLECELSNIKAGKPTSEIGAITQGFEMIANVFKSKFVPSTQPNAVNSADEAEGITVTVAGKPAFLVPIRDARPLGTVIQGGKRTITGLFVGSSPVFMSIQGLGYALIMINPIGNDKFEAVSMVYIETYSNAPITLTLDIESQVVISQIFPARTTGFLTQKSKVPINRQSGGAFGDMDMVIQIEAGVVK